MRRACTARWSGIYLLPRNPRWTIKAVTEARNGRDCDVSWGQRQRASLYSTQRHLTTISNSRPNQIFPDIPKISLLDKTEQTPQSVARNAALSSAKLASLHARLSLPARFSLPMLARCLTHSTANSDPAMNNSSLAILGQELLAYYTAEWLICHYPRLPMAVIFAAQYAYVGDKTLALMRQEWGVEAADAPAEGVDPGLLRFERATAGNALADDLIHQVKHLQSSSSTSSAVLDDSSQRFPPSFSSTRPRSQFNDRRGISSRIVYDDEFGSSHSSALAQVHSSTINALSSAAKGGPLLSPPTSLTTSTTTGITLETASATFIRSLFATLYLTAGLSSLTTFHKSHILSRHLALDKLFFFRQPTRDLSRLCSREGLEPPIARLLSETGRKTRAPVFVVGVYSGGEKLGEDAGSSLDEARNRAAAAALRGWYLYSPPLASFQVEAGKEEEDGSVRRGVCLPSSLWVEGQGKRWTPQMIDRGEVVV